MIWALQNGQRIEATPKQKATCPLCVEDVISKCGSIKKWHWSHKSKINCDSFGENETEWHINWKNNFPKECQEVVIENHRADVKTKSGKVIEFQNSPITPEKIYERELFYGNMIWVLNGKNHADTFCLIDKGDYYSFRWKHPKKSFFISNKPIYIDFSDYQKETWKNYSEEDEWGNWHHAGTYKEFDSLKRNIFLIKKINKGTPCYGYGLMLTKGEFLNRYE